LLRNAGEQFEKGAAILRIVRAGPHAPPPECRQHDGGVALRTATPRRRGPLPASRASAGDERAGGDSDGRAVYSLRTPPPVPCPAERAFLAGLKPLLAEAGRGGAGSRSRRRRVVLRGMRRRGEVARTIRRIAAPFSTARPRHQQDCPIRRPGRLRRRTDRLIVP